MSNYQALAVATSFWKPGDDFLAAIITGVEEKVVDGDFVVISEKALSTAVGNIVDESRIPPSLNAKFLARFWMRICWGYLFSSILRFGNRLTHNLREYPLESGSRHKQLALEQAGPFQALMFGSEGAIDGSNLPYAYVSLPLKNSEAIAANIRHEIFTKLKRDVTTIIVDTDKTFSFHNLHFTARPNPFDGIHGNGGVLAYFAGRVLKFKKRPTPLAIVGQKLSVEEALRIANIADKARGTGSGTTVWKMALRFGVAVTGVTWGMLSAIRHTPIVLVRRKRRMS